MCNACLFVCLEFFVPLKNFHSFGDTPIAGEWVQKIDQYSTLMVIEQWGFFSVPHELWHRASVYNGHLRGPLTLTPNAERLATVLSLLVLTSNVCRHLDSNSQPSACVVNALTHGANAAA